MTDTTHCKDNWETPFITKTIEIYPPTRDATSNQHLADKEDNSRRGAIATTTTTTTTKEDEEGSNCALQRHAELDDEDGGTKGRRVAGYKIRRSFGKTDGTRPFTRCSTQVLRGEEDKLAERS